MVHVLYSVVRGVGLCMLRHSSDASPGLFCGPKKLVLFRDGDVI